MHLMALLWKKRRLCPWLFECISERWWVSQQSVGMMGDSVLWVVCIVAIFVCGGLQHANGERSAGNSNIPRKISIHSVSDYRYPSSGPNAHRIWVPGSSPSPFQASFSYDSAPPLKAGTSTVENPSKPVSPLTSMGIASSVPTQQSAAPMPGTRRMHHPSLMILMIVILAPLILGAVMLFMFCKCVYWHHRRFKPPSSQSPAVEKQLDINDSDSGKGLSLGPFFNRLNSFRNAKRKGCASAMEYSVLQAATNNFSSYNILGEGGFGCVYKARFNDDFFAAVKKLDEARTKAEDEFQKEVELMSKIRHPNIVSLLGFCIHEKTRLLVYELMQNGSLEDQLHGPSHGSALTWFLRLKIALDAARGLAHLHEHCNIPVIHCDFKSSNILLDASFNAKLSDFGLAVTDAGARKSNVELLGTLGYVAPEYLLDGELTEKSDVYAYGVVLLELITGRKPVDKSMPTGSQSLVTWAMPQLTDRSKLPTIVDPMIKDTMNLKHLYQVAAVAVLCVQAEPCYRPLIADVVHSLIPLVPVELGGALRNADASSVIEMKSLADSNFSANTTGPEI